MARIVPVFFDFVCPWSYAARARETRLQRELNVQFVYLPWELEPATPPQGRPNPHPVPDDRLRRFTEENGRELRVLGVVPRSRLALRGLYHAQAVGAHEAYLDRCFEACWEEEADLQDEEALRRIARESGLDEEALLQACHDAAWDAHLRAVDALAKKAGVETTVTYLLPDGKTYQALGTTEEVRACLARALGLPLKAR